MKTASFFGVPMMLGVIMTLAFTAPAQAQDTPAPMTLDQAIETAVKHSPHIAAASARTSAAAANRAQTGALPNPELSIDVENIYGGGAYNGFDSAETTYGISQLIELPSKRGSRLRAADAEKTKADYAQQTSTLDLLRDIHIAFAEVAAAQQDVTIRQEQQNLAAEVRSSVISRVEAGKEPPIQKSKADIEFSASTIAAERASRNLKAKQRTLALLIGATQSALSVDSASMPPLSAPDEIEAYRTRLHATPDLKAMNTGIEQAEAGFAFEKASTLPDPTLSLGVKDMRGEDTQALVAGISFPIPVFNRNRAGIERAGYEVTAARMDLASTHNEREASLNTIYADYSSAYGEAKALEATVLPGAEEAFHFAREGYAAGKFGYLEVLDAQRTLFDARAQLNTAILEYHRQRAQIERLTAAHLQPTGKETSQ